MELLDYLKFFDHTCICMDVPEDYVTKSLIYDGNNTKQETEQIQFALKLNGPINCEESPLSLEVIQQGEKLSRYRADPPVAEAVPVIVLLDGKFQQIDSNVAPCQPIFSIACINDQGTMNAGEDYTVVVQITWGPKHKDKELKKFMLKVSSPVDFEIATKGVAF
jgi:hypothetical protein